MITTPRCFATFDTAKSSEIKSEFNSNASAIDDTSSSDKLFISPVFFAAFLTFVTCLSSGS